MQRSHLVLGIMLATSLVATGCAGKVRVASSKSCQAHGGAYNATTKSCTYAASTRSAKQVCDAGGGYYEPVVDICEYGND